jgi:glycosyltransferase involved in cell wall biosynthesis
MDYLFLSTKEKKYSRTWTYFHSLSEQGYDCEYVVIPKGKIWTSLIKSRRQFDGANQHLIIASASQILAIPSFLIFWKRPVLDAGWSLFESTRVNSRRAGLLGKNLLKSYVIDFSATLVSKKVFLESNLQKSWYIKKFPFKEEKFSVIYTGVDESDFKPDSNELSIEDQSFKVIFRGKHNDEAGLDVLAEATQLLSSENIDFEILTSLKNKKLQFSSRTKIISKHFESKKEIANHLIRADLSLGQLSAHERLRRTIPHKAFESAYLGIPYLSARNQGILEIFDENLEMFCFEPGSSSDLAAKILFLSKNRYLLAESSVRIKAKYDMHLNQKKLAADFLSEIND